MFDPNTMKMPDFLEELNQGAEKAFGENAQALIDSLLNAKLPPKLKRFVNMARLENASYEEILTHLEREPELNGFEGVTTFLYLQCQLPLQQHDRVLAFFLRVLIPLLRATTAKKPGTSRNAGNSKEWRNNSSKMDRVPERNIQNV